MAFLLSTRRSVLRRKGRISYLLRVPFTAANQGYSDAQVLDTVAEGVQDGQLTVVEKDGTLAVVSNECAFTAQATPTWGDQGFYSQAVTRSLGLTLLGTVNVDATNTTAILALDQAADAGLTRELYFAFISDGNLDVIITDGANPPVVLERLVDAFAYAASTDYQLAIVLGGYDVNGVPFYAGQTPADYLYGAAFFVKGGAFGSNWTLLWRTALGNTATLYAAFTNYDAAGTLD